MEKSNHSNSNKIRIRPHVTNQTGTSTKQQLKRKQGHEKKERKGKERTGGARGGAAEGTRTKTRYEREHSPTPLQHVEFMHVADCWACDCLLIRVCLSCPCLFLFLAPLPDSEMSLLAPFPY